MCEFQDISLKSSCLSGKPSTDWTVSLSSSLFSPPASLSLFNLPLGWFVQTVWRVLLVDSEHRRLLHHFSDLCFLGELPQNCKEVKRLNSASVDGEYFLIVRGKPLKVSAESSHCLQTAFTAISALVALSECLMYFVGILCRDAFRLSQGVCDPGPWWLREFLRSLRAQVGDSVPEELSCPEVPRETCPFLLQCYLCCLGCTTQQNVPIMGAGEMTAIAGRITQLLASPLSRKSESTWPVCRS